MGILHLALKFMKYNCNIHPKFRWEASLHLTKLTKACPQNFIKNRYFLTGRAGGFLRLSRIQLRRLACNNELFGLRKATW
jgi:ribosomal protein S14